MKRIHYTLGDQETSYEGILIFVDDVTEDEITYVLTESLNDWSMEHYQGDPDNEEEWEDYCCETWYDYEEVSDEDAEFIIHTAYDNLFKFGDKE